MQIDESKGLECVASLKVAGATCGIKASGKPDIAVLYYDEPVVAAGMFTKNEVRAAPVKWCEKINLENDTFRGVVVNAGNANACTGEQGIKNLKLTVDKLSALLNAKSDEFFVCSTGIIGQQLPIEKLLAGVENVVSLTKKGQNRDVFSKAIMTTDLVEKKASLKFTYEGKDYFIGGCCKGSGMIHPNMATMLAFIATDLPMTKNELQKAVKFAVDRSFNCLTVDGDTSTNDTVLVFAPKDDKTDDKRLSLFQDVILLLSRSLAKQIAKDGEGAEHFIEIKVNGGRDYEQAQAIARSIANSSLVKTAIAGNDPNWGRVLCAIGYAEQKVEEDKIKISIQNVPVFSAKPLSFDAKNLSERMRDFHLSINVDLGLGNAQAEFYTCDLTHGYITINADYHT